MRAIRTAAVVLFGLLLVAGYVQPVVTVPANGSLTVAVAPGVVSYGWHGTRHGSENRHVTVPVCPNSDEALVLSNDDSFARPVKIFLEPNSLRTPIKGTDTSITVVATCDPAATPIP